MYFTYVLQSERDSKLYIGFTKDLRSRLTQHDNGEVRSTSVRRPLSLIYYEACLNEIDAIEREKYLKTGYGRRYIRNRLANHLVKS